MSNAKYKRKRIIAAKRTGRCIRHWRNKALLGRTECQNCVDYTKVTRARARKNNMCLNHLIVSARPGKTTCAACGLKRKLDRLRKLGVSEFEIKRASDALDKFDGTCESCGGTDPGSSYGEFCVDHKDNKFRGIICHSCNLCLGYVKDNPEKLEAIAAYARNKV
jgi:hypothetical protein